VIAALQRAGFAIDRVAGSHYILVRSGDAVRAVTVPYHGAHSLKTGTLRSIIRQAGMTPDGFREFL
jgi:predicted RNA binding protein YcfA (HicA-like mRNA interferase family)